jgi:hypothetical protein
MLVRASKNRNTTSPRLHGRPERVLQLGTPSPKQPLLRKPRSPAATAGQRGKHNRTELYLQKEATGDVIQTCSGLRRLSQLRPEELSQDEEEP